MVQGSNLEPSVEVKSICIVANTTESINGLILVKKSAKPVDVLYSLNTGAYYDHLANSLVNHKQSAPIGSFGEQKAIWSRPQKHLGTDIAKDRK
jgi:hypothetical protein